MKIFVNFLIMLFMVITSISCTKQAGLSSFLSLGRVADGDISFSYEGTTGNIVNVGDVLRVKPSKLETINAKIIDCKIKAGTASLPSGFSVNPLTCEIVGATLSSLPNTIYTLEVINSLGKKSEAYVELRVRSRLTFTGSVSGLTAGQSVAISLTVNGTVVESQTISTNGSYELQNLFDSDSFSLATIHNDNTNYTCTPGTASATVYANVVNNITCFGSGERTVTTLVQGLGASATVNLRLVSDSVNYDLTNAGNGTHSLAALTVGKTYSVEILSTSVGYACFIQSNASGTVNVTAPSVIQCAANGPYTFTIKTRGINAGSISVRKDGILYLNGVGNGDHVLIGASADQYYGSNYNITFENTPANHTCSISNNTGMVLGNTVVDLTCEANTFSVSGSVSGLDNGESVKIQAVTKTGKKEVVVDFSNQNFSFDPFEYNTPYELSLSEVPATKVCTFTTSNYKSGNILGNVSGVSLNCTVRSANRCDVGNIKLDTFNGEVKDVSCDATHMYVAGSFTEVGERAIGFYSAVVDGSLSPTPSDSNAPQPFNGFGSVGAIAIDADGGFYLGSSGSRGVEYFDSNKILKKKILFSGSSIQNLIIGEDSLYVATSSVLKKLNRFTGVEDVTFKTNIGTKCYSSDKLVIVSEHVYCIRDGSTTQNYKIHKKTGVADAGFTIQYDGYSPDSIYSYNNEIFITLNSNKILRYNYANNLVRTYVATGGSITSLEFYNGIMFVSGGFSAIDGVNRNRFAEIDLSSHSLANTTNLTMSTYLTQMFVNQDSKILYMYTPSDNTYNSSFTKKGIVAYNLISKTFVNFHAQLGSVDEIISFGSRVFAVGSFSTVNAHSKRGLAALKLSDGHFDSSKTFQIDTNYVSKIFHDKVNHKITAIGNLAVGAKNSIARFLSNGTLDGSFSPPIFNSSLDYLNGKVVPDNLSNPSFLYVSGSFSSVGGFPISKIAKLNYTDGSLVSSFNLDFVRLRPSDSVSETASIFDIYVNNSDILIAGNFTSIKGNTLYPYLTRVDLDGNLLPNSNQFPVFNYPTMDYAHIAEILTNGSVFNISGNFTDYQGDTDLDNQVNITFNGANEPLIFTNPKLFNNTKICVTTNGYLYSRSSSDVYKKPMNSSTEVFVKSDVGYSFFCTGESLIGQKSNGVLDLVD